MRSGGRQIRNLVLGVLVVVLFWFFAEVGYAVLTILGIGYGN